MKFAQLTQESLLASEKLIQDRLKAEASTPQVYEEFVKTSEQDAIEEREAPEGDDFSSDGTGDESAGGSNGQEQNPNDPDAGDGAQAEGEDAQNPDNQDSSSQDSQSTEDSSDSDPFADSVDNEAHQTTEALSDWIREKTQYSESGFVRNAGALAAGLAHIGVTYGPMTISYMFKGMLWAFSRLGTVLFDASKALSNYIEKSNNSIQKLEARLTTAEQAIISQLNEGSQMPSFVYKNQRAISYLKVGDNVDVTGNLRVFAGSLQATCNSVADEFSSGVSTIDKIASSDGRRKVSSLKPIMEVSVPRQNFKAGKVRGYEPNNDLVQQFHTEPLWPGDATLIFNRPVITSDDITTITQAYSKADMFVGIIKPKEVQNIELKSLSGPQAVVLAKSIRILLSSMKDVSKSQQRMLELSPKISLKAKQLFYKLADGKAKVALNESLVEPMYLRGSLAATVFVNGSTSSLTHASRVAACAIAYLEAHASRITTSTE